MWVGTSTVVTGTVITAAWGNTVRDNLGATAAAIVTTQGDTVYATGANALARLPKGTGLQIYRMNSGATAPEWVTLTAALVGAGTFPAGSFAFDTNTLAVDGTNHRVGVGTATPAERLHVYGSGVGIRVEDSSATGNSLLLRADGTNGPAIWGHTDSSGNSTINTAAVRVAFGSNGMVVGSSPATAIGSPRTFTDKFIVATDGSVRMHKFGVGIATFDSSGNVSSLTTATLSGSGNILIVDTTTLVVDATNHRVGIGTASPSYLLDVAGQARAQGFVTNIVTVANNAVAQLCQTASPDGIVAIKTQNANVSLALFTVSGTGHTTEKTVDNSNGFSITATTATKTNIYWSAGNSRYEIENKSGGSLTYIITLLGTP